MEDSCYPNGFWHPYGRGANIPPTRVVCLAPEAVAQVTLKLPDPEAIAAAQVSPSLTGTWELIIRAFYINIIRTEMASLATYRN